MQSFGYHLRVIWACAKKDMLSAVSDLRYTSVTLYLPLNFLIFFSLFAISGGEAPTAVVLQDNGPYAQQLYTAMANAHSFQIRKVNVDEANRLMQDGKIVAIVTIPADFDTQVAQNAPVKIHVDIDNLNTDFTHDIRRAIPLSITSFYAKAFPDLVTIAPAEHDLYPQDTDYIAYLTIPVFVIGLMLTGLLQSGTTTAREWEYMTIKELLLSPAARWAIMVGKMLGALVVSMISAGIVLAVLVLLVRVWPVNWGEVIGFTLLTLVIFLALGALLGTVLRQRQAFAGLAFGASIPLFFVSGAFGPISFSPPIVQVFAQIFPVYYSIVLQQHAFHGFDLNTYGVGTNVLILCVYAVVLIVLASFALRRSTVV